LNRYFSSVGDRFPGQKTTPAAFVGPACSGGDTETWVYEYYDTTPTGPSDSIDPGDLLASAASLLDALTSRCRTTLRDQRRIYVFGSPKKCCPS
jgi:hypothetical protein